VRPLVVAVIVAHALAAAAAPPAKRGEIHLAFVLLAKPTLPPAQQIVRAHAAFAPPGERLTISKAKSPPTPGSTQILEFDVAPHGHVFVALFPAAVPGHEAEDAARLSVSSLAKPWTPPPHTAHAVVTLTEGDGPPVEALSRFTAIVAAVTEASHAVGVYWGAAPVTHPAEFFTKIARERGIACLMLWIGVGAARQADGRLSLLSYGMKQLSLPDLLVIAPAGSASSSVPTFFDLLSYVAERGKPLPEGDTVGRTDEERLPVHYVASPLAGQQKVWRVELR
jgi:uncharacterized protein DUF4261